MAHQKRGAKSQLVVIIHSTLTTTSNNPIRRFGSVTQASTVRISEDVFIPLANILPTVNPDDIIVDGWDISSKNIFEAVKRSQVFEPALQEQLQPHLENFKPRKAIFNQDFIADNQVCYPLNVNSDTNYKTIQINSKTGLITC